MKRKLPLDTGKVARASTEALIADYQRLTQGLCDAALPGMKRMFTAAGIKSMREQALQLHNELRRRVDKARELVAMINNSTGL